MAKPRPARGGLDPGGAGVTVPDPAEAQDLHARTLAGELAPGSALRLSTTEAAWCVAQGRLTVSAPAGPLDAPALIRLGPKDAAEAWFLAYADLRERGLVARHAGGAATAGPTGPAASIAVWPRGQGAQGEPAYHVVPASGRSDVAASELAAWAAARLVAAVADDDGAVTYYRLSRATPAGRTPMGEAEFARLPSAAARPAVHHAVVTDPAAVALQAAHFGTPTAAGLMLSASESALLAAHGRLALDDAWSVAVPEPRLAAERTLRAAGTVPRSGFKFGTDLRVYPGAPTEGHAQWLVDCAAPADRFAWAKLARGIRVAHGVRKSFLVAVADEAGDVAFAELAWFKP